MLILKHKGHFDASVLKISKEAPRLDYIGLINKEELQKKLDSESGAQKIEAIAYVVCPRLVSQFWRCSTENAMTNEAPNVELKCNEEIKKILYCVGRFEMEVVVHDFAESLQPKKQINKN